MSSPTSHILSVLCQRFGLNAAPAFYRSPIFLSALAIGAAVWFVLPFLVVAQPLPWLHIFSRPFLVAVLWQPIVEELLFRGCLQGWLVTHGWGSRSFVKISLANLLTSAVFVGAHLATHSPPWALSTLFPSLLFGILRDRFGSVLPSIVLHIIYNAGYFMLTGGCPWSEQ